MEVYLLWTKVPLGPVSDIAKTKHKIELSISGGLFHEHKTGNQTDQSKSPYPMTSTYLIGQFDFPFYVHRPSNLKSTAQMLISVTVVTFILHDVIIENGACAVGVL